MPDGAQRAAQASTGHEQAMQGRSREDPQVDRHAALVAEAELEWLEPAGEIELVEPAAQGIARQVDDQCRAGRFAPQIRIEARLVPRQGPAIAESEVVGGDGVAAIEPGEVQPAGVEAGAGERAVPGAVTR